MMPFRTDVPTRCRTLAALLAVAAAILAPGAAEAVILDDEDVVTVVLTDGTTVTLYGEADPRPMPDTGPAERPNLPELADELIGEADEGAADTRRAADAPRRAIAAVRPLRALSFAAAAVRPTKRYYYLPSDATLRLSRRPDGTPEFLFLKFTTEESGEQGGMSGGVLHFLMEWGLTADQQAELRTKLAAQRPGAILAGAVPMQPIGETGTFRIISATLSDESLAPSVVTSGKAPLMPGGKVAAAARLSANGAQLLDASLERNRSIADVSIQLDFAYTTLTPAARGWITFNWEKLQAERQTIEAEYTATEEESTDWGCFLIFCAYWEEETYSYSYDELREFYRFMEEKKIVELSFDELVEDERVDKIRDAFFDYFLQSMTEAVPPPPEQAEGEDPYQMPDIQKGSHYTFNREVVQAAFERKTDSFNLNYRLAVKRPHQIVGNLASWYDHVEDNPKCVSSVVLNDPFFQHRDIHFILGLDGKEIFDQAINYVTVKVQKPRDQGRDFSDHVTIDSQHLSEHGVRATVTYARGEDTNPDLFRYAAQWSLKSGELYPAEERWIDGSWEGVTLLPPVVARTIELEADLAQLEAAEITRVTAQVRYYRFGQEVEENIHLSTAQGEGLTQEKIFTDRGTRGYVYRLVLNHKSLGKLALDWQPQIGDDYIFANLPPELIDREPTIVEAAQQAAREIAAEGTEKVLDRFRDLIVGGDE